MARAAWYIGVLGYIMFFGFRYYIARKRRNTIQQYNLLEKLDASDMEKESKEEIRYLLDSLIKSREILNYRYIFVTSGVAILLDIFLTVLI